MPNRKIILKTEDGINIYNGDLFWNANWVRDYEIKEIHAYDTIVENLSKKSKNFSTKELAIKWLKEFGEDPFKYLADEFIKSKIPMRKKLDDLMKIVFSATEFRIINEILSTEERMCDLDEDGKIKDEWINVKDLEKRKRYM